MGFLANTGEYFNAFARQIRNANGENILDLHNEALGEMPSDMDRERPARPVQALSHLACKLLLPGICKCVQESEVDNHSNSCY